MFSVSEAANPLLPTVLRHSKTLYLTEMFDVLLLHFYMYGLHGYHVVSTSYRV